MPRPIYSITHWIRGWEDPTTGLKILEALAGIERSLGSPAGSLVTIPTDIPRLRSEDAHSGHAGSHPGPHLGYCCRGFWFNYFIPLGKCLKLNDRILTRRLQVNIHESPCTILPHVFWFFNNRKYTRTVCTCSCFQWFHWHTGQAAQTNVSCYWTKPK
jgi:hypothetical protein